MRLGVLEDLLLLLDRVVEFGHAHQDDVEDALVLIPIVVLLEDPQRHTFRHGDLT